MANRSNIEECFAKENYMEAWSCYNGYPHSAGHGAVGGLVSIRGVANPRTTLRTNPWKNAWIARTLTHTGTKIDA